MKRSTALPILSIFVLLLIALLYPRFPEPAPVVYPSPTIYPTKVKTVVYKKDTENSASVSGEVYQSALGEQYPSFLIPEDIKSEYGSESGHN